ncbi:MAG: CoA transferase [Alphaproteobacteria bacterium]|nr:CoA transferase [Alphaproteobacteria bacterium]
MTRKGPLDDLLVIDLSRVLAGPYATMVLADLGARVVKVETPGTGDDARHFPPFMGGKSAYFMSLNRGKESIALNLKDADDCRIFEDLVARADILVENYRPGTMEKLGYGWEKLQLLNPQLIYCAVSGFGHSGPYAKRPAYDMVVQGMGGIMSVTGYPDSGPTRVGTSIGDITAGLFGLSGILAAVHDRERNGKGAFVDVGMLDCQVAILENAISRYLASGDVPGPLGARHPSITPFEAFATADGHIIIAAGNDSLFAKLVTALGKPELAADPAFGSNATRTENSERLRAEVEDALASKPASEWLEIIGNAGVPCGPINDISQVVTDPHVTARNMIISAHDEAAGEIRMAGNPIKVTGFDDPAIRPAAPDLDADRASIEQIIADRQPRFARSG